jgi:hypothetical protein
VKVGTRRQRQRFGSTAAIDPVKRARVADDRAGEIYEIAGC